MKAVIMAGGFGTRLRPLTSELPKPMVPVMNRPLLERTLALLRRHGCRDVVFLLHYLPEKISKYFGDGQRFGMRIQYVVEREDYGTAGAVRRAADLLDEPFYVLSGDALTDLDLTAFRDFHFKRSALATLALANVSNPPPFGIALAGDDGRISRFLEKPAWGQVFSDTVNMGIYVLQPVIFDFIAENRESYFARDLFPRLVEQKSAVFGFAHRGYWRDIGDVAAYQQAHWDALSGKIDLEGAGRKRGAGDHVVAGEGSRIAASAEVSQCVFGKECRIGEHAKLKRVILWNGVKVGRGAELSDCVLGRNVRVEDGVVVEEQSYISDRVVLQAGCHINSNIKIWPGKTIEPGAVVNSSLVWGKRWRRELFTDSRVSGVANLEVTPEFAAKLGAAYGGWLGEDARVLLSRDTSPVARMVYRALITGLMSAGVDVSTLQVMPIPIVRYVMRSSPETGALHIRRSATEPSRVDILFLDGHGRDYGVGAAKAIERIFFQEDFPRVAIDDIGKIAYPVRAVEMYERHFIEHIDATAIHDARFKIVLDYSFGAAIQVFPSILSSLDCDVLALNAHPDPAKLHRTPEQIEAALEQLARVVKSTHADAGFWFDTGAERLRVVDNRGRILSDQRLAILLAKIILGLAPDVKIAAPVSVPSQIEKMVSQKGCQLMHTAVDGSAVIKSTEDPAVRFALDTRGRFIFPDFHFAFDAMFTLAKILQYLATTGMKLGETSDTIPPRAFLQSAVECPWEAKGRMMREATAFSENKPRLLLDGVKLLLQDASVLIRPDKERPLCHLLVEAADTATAEKVLAEYRTRIVGWIG